jgi:tRNA modification GTPase
VNAGKSTLFNRLAGSDRAIASPHPGTTRDAVVAEVSVRGLAVELVDTAGLGAVRGDALAAEAQEFSRSEAARADLVVLVLSATEPFGPEARAAVEPILRAARRTLLVLNKCDLVTSAFPRPGDALPGPALQVSALTGSGIEALLLAMVRALLVGEATS